MTTQVLLIDPDINFMVSIKTALEGTGEFRVSVAANGWAADELLRHGSPEVAVVDFDIPDMDVVELLQRIRVVRPGLPVILTPFSAQQHERARLIGANEILGKPYSGRDLIPIVYAVLQPKRPVQRIAPEEETASSEPPDTKPLNVIGVSELFGEEAHERPDTDVREREHPRAADILEEFEALERLHAGTLSDQDDEASASAILRDVLDQVQHERDAAGGRSADEEDQRADNEYELPETGVLPSAPTLQPTKTLIDTDELDEHRRAKSRLTREADEAVDTDGLDRDEAPEPDARSEQAPDELADESGKGVRKRPQTKPLKRRYGEPPIKEGDTPAVPHQDSQAMRQFLATDQSGQPPHDFGEALDAVARHRPDADDRSPDDRAFHDLVESMRPRPEATRRRTRLEELIQSLAAASSEGDLALEEPDAAVDFLLDAMRQDKSRLTSPDLPFDPEDTTIGEVIDGLFEPSFEGVLAALAGDDVDEAAIQEPTYEAEGKEARAGAKGADLPPTLPEESTDLAALEPPIGEEDSRRYPATAALTALTAVERDDEDTDRFSLDDLLRQIEAQLPPARSHRPRLKPLPSWDQTELLSGVRQVEAMFDHVEGLDHAPPAERVEADELPEIRHEAFPIVEEPDISKDDTIPSQALLDAIDTVQDGVTRPVPPVIPDEAERDYADEYAFDQETEDHAGAAALFAEADFPARESEYAPTYADEEPEDIDDYADAGSAVDKAEDDAFAEAGFLDDDFEYADAGYVDDEGEAEDAFAEAGYRDDEFEYADVRYVDDEGEAEDEETYAEAEPEAAETYPEADLVDAEAEYAPTYAEDAVGYEEGDAGPGYDEDELVFEPDVDLDESMAEPQVAETGPIGVAYSGDRFGEEARPEAPLVQRAPEEDRAVELDREDVEPAWDLDQMPDQEPDHAVDQDLDREAEAVDEAEPTRDEFDTAFEIEFDTGLLTMEDLLAIADLPVEAGTEEIQREIMERAAAAARADRLPEQETVTGVDEPEEVAEVDAEGYAQDYAEERAARAGAEDALDAVAALDADADEAAFYAVLTAAESREDVTFPPDEEMLVTVPADTAAMLIETGAASADEIEQLEDDEDESLIAAIAVQLTQFSLESSAQATMISRSGHRLAEAGNLPEAAMDRLFDLVDAAWQGTASDALIRFITLPEAGEFLLYSAQVEHDLMLSMIFHSAIPVRTIRKQARRLSESLELVPEEIEPPAARTRPSRPTDLKPPPGWAAKAVEEQEAEEQAAAADESVPVQPEPEEEVAYAAYTAMWLPADPTLELLDDLADGLAGWIEDIAADSAWELDDLAVFPDYVLVALRAPQTILPDDAIMRLMDETARLSREAFPDVANGGPLWTDGYYVVSPSRDLSDREIARFITYQRQAQLG